MTIPETIQKVLETADATVEKTLKDYNLPGLGVGIVYQGQLIYAKGVGQADVARNIPVTPDTVFRIASVSKTFAAVGLMQLWEQGKFDLHAPINDYLRDFKVKHRNPNAPLITFHHLLTHTAGLGEFVPLYKYFSPTAHFNVVRPNKPVPPLKHLYGRTLPAECLPGEKWCYANNGFATVGQLVADISGQPFPDYIRQHIYQPLDMKQSEFWRSDRVRGALAIGYNYKAKQQTFKPVIDLEQVTTAAGAMYSTVNDMGRYMAALMQSDALLKPETLELMYTPQYRLDERLQGMGYCFKIDDFGGHRVVSHDGLWLGFISSMFVAPDDELGVVALTNTANSIAIGLASSLMRRLLGEGRKLKSRPDPDSVPDTPKNWPSLQGFYGPKPGFNSNFRLWTSYGGELEVYQEENDLKVRSLRGSWKEGKTLVPADKDDPLSFRARGREVIFTQDGRLLMGLNEFGKRPYNQSIRRRLKLLLIGAGILLVLLLILLLVLLL
ncbi:MAG: beta-lactamase family protein [Ardenticatenaceae bacterium]|nr:beta-lactamase family protein [Ardenticatenaceae bacterium]